MKLEKEQTSLKAEHWVATVLAVQQCIKNLVTQISEAAITVRPYIVDWIENDII